MVSPRSFVVLCASLLGAVHATLIPDKTQSQPPATTTYYQPGCPSKVGLANGGFENGKTAPWAWTGPEAGNISIASPGYKSKHALQLDFKGYVYAPLLEAEQTGKVCFGYWYNISYAYNWVKYTGPEGYCNLQIFTGYTDSNAPTHNATQKPGWHYHSYTTRDYFSHCESLQDNFLVQVSCAENSNKTLAPFSVQVDMLNIQTLPISPVPYPPPVEC